MTLCKKLFSLILPNNLLKNFVDFLCTIYDNEEIGTIIVKYGPIHDFVEMKLDYSVSRKFKIDMVKYTQNIMDDFEMKKFEIRRTRTQRPNG